MTVEYLIPAIGYLSGSIPFGYILVKAFHGTDVRKQGSGNIGATNVFRKNRLAGILTLLLDGAKGYIAVITAASLGADPFWQAIAAVSAICGHVFTVWLAFKGGKGVATGCGAYLAISPAAVATALVIFVLTTALTRYISLASILAASAFPLFAFFYREPSAVVLCAAAGSAVIVAKHHQNIRRLLMGTEHKFAAGSRP
jgi:glycerol-3-phosphate acyltransferase PlsY